MPTATSSHMHAPGAASPLAPDVVDLSVVIVNYNVREFLEQALRSVQRASQGLEVEVFVVDNASVDGSVEMVQTCFPEVRVLANGTNVGFSTANNQAIREARGRYLLILNPDTIVQEDTLTTLVRFMDARPEAGAVGCQILNPDGTFAPESRRAFPRPTVAFYRISGLSRLFPHSPRFGRYNMTYLPRDEVAEVDALSGSCMLVRHAALHAARPGQEGQAQEVEAQGARDYSKGAGLLDEDFFMYGEDLDWCYRIQQAGWKIYYTPETQIIHYKGESTKKGELRYVRLFYGAMLRFTEKHFQNRYARFFTLALRLGIVVRAGITVVANAGRTLAAPLFDVLLVLATVSAVGSLHAISLGARPAPLFFAAVAPAYALGTAAGIALAGGYRRHRRRHLRPAWTGAALGLLLVATLSFFVKVLAFSRAVVLLGFVFVLLALTARRLAGRAADRRAARERNALLVGPLAEAERLQGILARHPSPPFTLTGYVVPGDGDGDDARGRSLPRLGGVHQLRDLVRLRRIDDVVFAADGLSNRTVFQLIQQLRDLPVHCRILAAGREHVIGKAAIDDLSLGPLLEAEEALGEVRSMAARRAFEIPVALIGLALHPVCALLARFAGPSSVLARLAAHTRRLPAVLAGTRALVGYRTDDACPQLTQWGLRPGTFSIIDTLSTASPTPDECNRAYWFYVRNQSAWLDGEIVLRSLRNARRGPLR